MKIRQYTFSSCWYVCLFVVGVFCWGNAMPTYANTVRLNEVMSLNASTLADDDGDYESWVELYNYGFDDVDLSGWGLSDDLDNPFRWTFPADLIMHPGDYLLVWASGKDRTHWSNQGRWDFSNTEESRVMDLSGWENHATIAHDASVELDPDMGKVGVLGASGEIQLDKTMTLDGDFTVAYWFLTHRANSWRVMNHTESLNGSIGHWNPGRIGLWEPDVNIDLSDSFQTGVWQHFVMTRQADHVTVYRNGEVAGSNTWNGTLRPDLLGGRSGGTSWDGFEGKMADVVVFPYAVNERSVEQLYEDGVLPPGPLAPLHSNFSVSALGEDVLLTDSTGTLVDHLPPTPLPRDVSAGRGNASDTEWVFFSEATPGAPNHSNHADTILDPIQFSHKGGFYTNIFDLELFAPETGLTILYTLDGSEPDIDNIGGTTYLYKNSYPRQPGDPVGEFKESTYETDIYSEPIPIYDRSGEPDKLTQMASTSHVTPPYFPDSPVRKGTVIRAKAIRDGAIDSPITTHSYFVFPEGNPYSIPVVSLTIQEDRLFSYSNGIYTAGVDFDEWRANNPTARHWGDSPGNFYRRGSAWEYPLNFEYFGTEQGPEAVVNQQAGFRIHGNWARQHPLKSLRFYPRRMYDEKNAMHYSFFSEDVPLAVHDENDYFRRIMTRGQGGGGGVFFDVVFNRLMQSVYEGVPRYRPTIHFVNGEYWGINFMRDRHRRFHWSYYYGLDPDNVATISCRGDDNSTLSDGIERDLHDYRDLRAFVADHDMAVEENYSVFLENFDLQSFADHLILNIFAGNSHYEPTFWRARIPEDEHIGDGRWRVSINDFDGTMQINEDFIRGHFVHGGNGSTMYRSLVDNESFRRYFVNRFADHLNTTFRPDRFAGIIDDSYAEIEPYLEEDEHRWNRNSWPYVGNVAFRDQDVQRLVDWAEEHPERQLQDICEYFGIATNVLLTVDVNDPKGGAVRVNTIDITSSTPSVSDDPYPWSGQYFHDIPVTLRAMPAEGQRVVGWRLQGETELISTDPVLELTMEEDTGVEAMFEAVPAVRQPVGLHEWDFEDAENVFIPSYSVGDGSLVFVPGIHADSEAIANTGGDFETQHLRVNYPLESSLTFALPTIGYEDVTLEYLTRRSGQGAGAQVLSYTTNGVDWVEKEQYAVSDTTPQAHRFDFSQISGVADNADFAVRVTFAQGSGGTAGNNRFDDVVLEGLALPGVNVPPIVASPPNRQVLTEGGNSIDVDLDDIFTDPSGAVLTYQASSAQSDKVSTSLSGAILTLSPEERGESLITVSADDGHNPPVETSFHVLVYPAAHVVEEEPFGFDLWDANMPEGAYPQNMLFLQTSKSDPGVDAPLEHAYFIEHDDYHADDTPERIGYPYSLTGRSRINGLGEDGISFINTGRDRDLGGALVALDTRGADRVSLRWLGATLLANDRIYAIRLQYRVGTTGSFVDVLDAAGNPVEYVRSDDGDIQLMDPVDLPSDALEEEYVQVLWRYYHISGDSGPRAQLRLDDIYIDRAGDDAASKLDFDYALPSHWQSGQPLPPVSVRAVSDDGWLDPDYEGDISLELIGVGTLSGTTTVQAEGGVATFDDLTVSGTGLFQLQAESGELDPTASSLLQLASVDGIIVPQYIQGGQDAWGDNHDRVPFVYRARIEGLLPDTTYRIGNRMVTPDDPWDQNGAGNSILLQGADQDWVRNTDAPRFRPDDLGERHVEITTDAVGAYEGWFVTEPTGNDRFAIGNVLYPRLLLNDGAGGEETQHILTLSDAVQPLRFGSATGQGSGVMGQSAAPERSMVFLYDTIEGTGRPLAGTPVEITGSEVDDRYAGFYQQTVATVSGYWGTIIPNDLPDGVRLVEVRSFLDGNLLSEESHVDGLPGTQNASAGLNALWAGTHDGRAVFLPEGDGDWTADFNWSVADYPDGVGSEAFIGPPMLGNRNVTLRAPVTIGALTIDNADSPDRNRIDAPEFGHSLTFASSSGPAVLEVQGGGSGFAEFDLDAGAYLQSDLYISVTNLNLAHGKEDDDLEADYGALRLRREWSGPGGITLTGHGVMSLTGEGKDYTGPTVVQEGVLRVTEPSAPGYTSALTVHPGGQLRLVSGGDERRVYHFGSPLLLSGMGRAAVVPEGEQLGVLGALRYDPGSNDNVAEVLNDITLLEDTSLHVDGTRNEMLLSGQLSGSGGISKSGGGMLTLAGSSMAYEGPITVSNGYLRLDGELGSHIALEDGTILLGRGYVGGISGSGTVSPEGGTLYADTLQAQSLKLTFCETSPALLRLSSDSPFSDSLTSGHTVEVYLNEQSLADGQVFRGGIFTDHAAEIHDFVSAADFLFYVRDPFGEVTHNGQRYSLYEGTLDVVGATVDAERDFGAGPVHGRQLELAFERDDTAGFSRWQEENFDAEELEDPAISGPMADPDQTGVVNLVRYALGLNPGDAVAGKKPLVLKDESGVLYEHRVLLDPDREIRYLIRMTDDLSAGEWDEAVIGEHLLPLDHEIAPNGVTAVRRYRVSLPLGERARYLQLMVIEM